MFTIHNLEIKACQNTLVKNITVFVFYAHIHIRFKKWELTVCAVLELYTFT